MNRPMRSWGFSVTAGLLIGASLSACADESVVAPYDRSQEQAGRVGIALTIGGTSLTSMQYVIENASHTYRGDIALGGAALVSRVVGGVEAGQGYRLTVNGDSAEDGGFSCTGTAGPFAVTARATSTVTIAIRCKRPSTSGSVMIGGSINLCPFIDTIVADPPIAGTIALHSTADDIDHMPSPLSYAWTASPGMLSGANQGNATLSCTQTGVVNVQLSVSDGDPECTDSLSLQVNCPSLAAASSAQTTPPVAMPDASSDASDAGSRDSEPGSRDAEAGSRDAEAGSPEAGRADAEAGNGDADAGARDATDAADTSVVEAATPGASTPDADAAELDAPAPVSDSAPRDAAQAADGDAGDGDALTCADGSADGACAQ